MPYPALPDMRMPYDNDGTVVAYGNVFDGQLGYITGSNLIAMNGLPPTSFTVNPNGTRTTANTAIWLFFPEQREVSAHWWFGFGQGHSDFAFIALKGSNDTANGMDGTWETASSSAATYNTEFDWRSNIRTVSFTGPKRVIRFELSPPSGDPLTPDALHLYGAKGAGQTPDDIVYLDQATSYAVFTAALDFGDVPLGTTATHQFKVQNASATKTANTINIQCNDADFAISSDGVTWVNTINIASLAAGASSGVLYVRDTTPNPGGKLGPRFARIVTTVASYT